MTKFLVFFFRYPRILSHVSIFKMCSFYGRSYCSLKALGIFLRGAKIILGGKKIGWPCRQPCGSQNCRSPRSTNWMRHRPASWQRPENEGIFGRPWESTLQEGICSILWKQYVSNHLGASIHIFFEGIYAGFQGEGRGDLIEDGDQGSLYKLPTHLRKLMYKLLVILRDFPLIVWVGNDPTVGSLGDELEVEESKDVWNEESHKSSNIYVLNWHVEVPYDEKSKMLWSGKNGRRWACEALESRNDADEALDKICHLARRQDGHLNQTWIWPQLLIWKKDICNKHIHFNSFIFFFVGGRDVWLTHLFRTDWGSCYLRWTPCGVQQAILLGRVALGKFKPRKLYTVDTLADFCRMVQFLVLHLPKFPLRVAPFVGKQGTVLHFYIYFSDTPTDVDFGKNRKWSNSLCDLKTPRWWLCWKTSKMELKSKLVPNNQRSVLISTRRRWWKFMEWWFVGLLVCFKIQEIQGPKKRDHKECLQ